MGGIPILATNDAPDVDTLDGFDAETIELLVKQTYLAELDESFSHHNWTIDDVIIQKHYGTYNGCVVVMMRAKNMVFVAIPAGEVAAGISFGYPEPNYIHVWKDGKLYSLQEAFELGFLSVDDIKQIADIHNSKNSNISENNEYEPRPKSPENLSDEQIKKIKEDFVIYWNKAEHSTTATFDKVRIDGYYGTYDGAIALFIDDGNVGYMGVVLHQTIAGYEFMFGSNWTMSIYKNGDFMELSSAYENGWITKQDLRDILYHFNGI